MTAKPLRSHQVASMTMLREALATGSKRPLLMLPTGAGKTRIAAEIINGALRKAKRVCFTVPAISLIDQSARAFWHEGIRDIGVMQADHPMTDPTRPVQIASVQTLRRRKLPEVDLVIVDEAHINHQVIRDWIATAGVPFVGLSATPWTKGLGQHYDKLIIPATIGDLIEAGWLAPFRVFAPSKPDLSKVRTVAGDWHEGDLSKVMMDKALTADIVRTWLEKAEGAPTLNFAVDRVHAKTIQVQYEAAGVPCGYVDMNTPLEEREAIGKRLEAGELKVVTSVGTLTTGVDWTFVRCIQLCRPTKSPQFFVQCIGRGLRPVFPDGFDPDAALAEERRAAMAAGPKPFCLMLDHSDTTLRLGFVTDIHREELDDGLRKTAEKAQGEMEAPKPKECPRCHYVRAASVRTCPQCGYVPEVVSKVETREGELVELTAAEKRNRTADWAEKISFMAQLKAYAKAKGKSDGWVSNRYKQRWSVWPNDPRVRYCEPAEVISPEVRSWLTAQSIRYAKGIAKARAHA